MACGLRGPGGNKGNGINKNTGITEMGIVAPQKPAGSTTSGTEHRRHGTYPTDDIAHKEGPNPPDNRDIVAPVTPCTTRYTEDPREQSRTGLSRGHYSLY